MLSAQEVLQVDKVHVWRGERHVLQGVSLTLGCAELLHVSGPNGTGKTTLLRVICGLLRPEQGQVAWRGRPIAEARTEYQADMAYASHEPALKSDLSAFENLQFSVGLKRRVPPLELHSALATMGLSACADLPARVLSAGQRRRVAMARVLAMQAGLWLLDEPFTNLDRAGEQLMSQLLQTHVLAGGSAVVIAHHELSLDCPLRRIELPS